MRGELCRAFRSFVLLSGCPFRRGGGIFALRQCSRIVGFPMQWGGLPLPGRALLFDVEK